MNFLEKAFTIQNVLAIMTVGGLFALYFVSALVKPVDAGVLNTAVALATMVLGWYFGSSKSSQDKDATIASQMPKPPNGEPPHA